MLEGDRKAREGARVDRLLRALGLPLAAALGRSSCPARISAR